MAGLKAVSGPADGPPARGDEQSWIDDWKKRATETLKKARDWAESEKAAARDRARRIAERVRAGARDIYRASPAAKAKGVLDALTKAANTITLASAIGTGVLTLGLLWLAWELLAKRRG